jgi:hypothetical protein
VHFQSGWRGPASLVRCSQSAKDQPAVQRYGAFGTEGRNQTGLYLAGLRVSCKEEKVSAGFAHAKSWLSLLN